MRATYPITPITPITPIAQLVLRSARPICPFNMEPPAMDASAHRSGA
jgi:hypothetical protein